MTFTSKASILINEPTDTLFARLSTDEAFLKICQLADSTESVEIVERSEDGKCIHFRLVERAFGLTINLHGTQRIEDRLHVYESRTSMVSVYKLRRFVPVGDATEIQETITGKSLLSWFIQGECRRAHKGQVAKYVKL